MSEDEVNKMVTIQIRLSDDLLKRIDKYRLASTFRPSRSMMFRYLLQTAMNNIEYGADYERSS